MPKIITDTEKLVVETSRMRLSTEQTLNIYKNMDFLYPDIHISEIKEKNEEIHKALSHIAHRFSRSAS